MSGEVCQPAMHQSPGRLVFVDETSVKTNMTPLRGSVPSKRTTACATCVKESQALFTGQRAGQHARGTGQPLLSFLRDSGLLRPVASTYH